MPNSMQWWGRLEVLVLRGTEISSLAGCALIVTFLAGSSFLGLSQTRHPAGVRFSIVLEGVFRGQGKGSKGTSEIPEQVLPHSRISPVDRFQPVRCIPWI